MKNKVLLVFCLTLTVCFVSGCSLKNSFKEKVTSDIEQKSGISMDKTYREYRTNVLKGNVKNSTERTKLYIAICHGSML